MTRLLYIILNIHYVVKNRRNAKFMLKLDSKILIQQWKILLSLLNFLFDKKKNSKKKLLKIHLIYYI